jgi:hypothetical protein
LRDNSHASIRAVLPPEPTDYDGRAHHVDGVPRPQGPNRDIGAYEFKP